MKKDRVSMFKGKTGKAMSVGKKASGMAKSKGGSKMEGPCK